MNTRTSRFIIASILPEANLNIARQDSPYVTQSHDVIPAGKQQSQSTPDAIGPFKADLEEFKPVSAGSKTFGLGDAGGGRTSPSDTYHFIDDDPEPELGPILTVSNPPKIEGDYGDNILEGSAVDNRIYGYGGNDTIFGNGGIDKIFGGEGEDDLFGGDDADYIYGEADADDLWGEEGDDFLSGGSGDDNLFGGPGNDLIQGDEGDDVAFGDAGDDTFFDNAGDDTYTGGEGADTFAFYELNFWAGAGGGQDLVLDFELGVDTLKIGHFLNEEFGGHTFNEYIDQFASGGGETGVVIEWANGLIRLPGIDKEDLNPWDIEILG